MKYFSSTKTVTSFSRQHEPAYYAELDENIIVETNDCYDGQVKTEVDLRSNIDMSRLNPATGPIYINQVQAGDTLCIEVLDIEPNDHGIMMASPGLGPLGQYVFESTTKILSVSENYIRFNEAIKIPMQAMIGVVGVAPEKGEIPTAVPGSHGGNLDTKDIKAGNKLYLPVFTDGALVAFGDLHAAMGDGELSGTGVEISGKIKVRFRKVPITLTNPVIEDDKSLYFVASGTSYSDAIHAALHDTVSYLQNNLKLSFEDSYRLMSATSDLKFSQIVNKLITVRVAVPKAILPVSQL